MSSRLSYGISVYSGNPTVDNNDISGCVSGAGVAAWASSAIDVWTGSQSALTNNNIHDCDNGIISNSASPAMSGNTFASITGDEVRLDYFVKGNPTAHWAEYYNTIQEAIDAITATTYPVIVWVAVYSGAGTYVEQVEVAKDCHIWGAGMGLAVIQSPAVLTKGWTTSTTNKPVVYIHDAADVLVGDLTIDGLGLGNANSRFIGVGFRNAGGAVAGCEVLNIKNTPLSGAQHGVAIYAYNNNTIARTITVQDCDIAGFQKNGMALISDALTPLTVDVRGNTVTGAGAIGVIAQNGIQIGSGVSNTNGAVADNTVSGIGYTGTGYVASSFLQYDGDVDFTGNTVTNSQVGIYNWDGSGDISENDITVSLIGNYCDGIIAADPSNRIPSPIVPGDEGAGSLVSRAPMHGTPLDVNITNNTVTFSGVTNTNAYGVETYAGCSPEDLDVLIDGNVVTGFDYGVVMSACTDYPSVFTNLVAQNNSITGNTSYGMYSDITYLTVDARNNWWGAQSGPYHATLNPLGTGNAVSDNILFSPWTGMYGVSVVPEYTITNCSTPKTVTFHIERTGTTSDQVRGYEVKFSLNNALVTAGNFVEGNYLKSVAPGQTQFFGMANGGGLYSVSCAILGGSLGAGASGDLFSVNLTPVVEGTSAITVTSVKVRDLNNAPLAAFATGGSIQIDCTTASMEPIVEAQNGWYNHAPTFSNFGFDDNVNLDLAEYAIDGGTWTTIFTGIDMASWDSDGWAIPGFDVLSEGSHTICFRVKDDAGNWNGEGTPDTYCWQFNKDTTAPLPPMNLVAQPGHNKVHLSWTNPPADPNIAGIEIRRVGWGDYPQYGTPGPGAPAYPSSPAQAVALVPGPAHDDASMALRDIYYYAVVTKDIAGNYSDLDPTGTDRSTNYWLADISPAMTGNGTIQINDLAMFSLTFGQIQDGPAWNAEGDFGPTDDWSRFGIPEPDDVVDFEDLMIMAMNYGNVSPLGTSGGPSVLASRAALSDQVKFRLVLLAREDGRATYAVMIENASEVLKGFSLKVSYGVGNEIESVTASKDLTGKSSEHFFGVIERGGGVTEICVAALGVDRAFNHTGEVARVVVWERTASPIQLKSADLRDLNNQRDDATLPGGGAETPFIPTTSAVMQNHPNPFNPTTAITYDVAAAGPVQIEIFDVSGHRIRTLVSGHKSAGRYTATWDGRDGNGTEVHSGVYFYRMTAPGYTSPAKKMLLLK